MHTLKDLERLMKSLEKEAEKAGFTLSVEPSNMDMDLFIIANQKSHKAACVGLTEINEQPIIVSYVIALKKWEYYETEGFTKDQMSANPLKSEIFTFKPVDELIQYLK
jgi:hypothetical protein